jgi:hypothetical protein
MGQDVFSGGKATGMSSQTNVFGAQAVSIDPRTVFQDTFDGAGFDVNRWTAAGTVPPTQPGTGFALVNPGTAASASSSLSTPISFVPTGFQIFIFDMAIEVGPIATGNHRFWGMGTQPGSWTAATPLQDAIGFEITTAGVLRAVVYSNGAVTYSNLVPLTIPTDGLAHRFIMYYRPGITFFFVDSLEIPILGPPALASPSNQILPIRIHSINGLGTTTNTPTMSHADMAMLDPTASGGGIADGSYPWRIATVKQASAGPAATDLALVTVTRPGLTFALTSAATTNASAVTATPVTLFTITCSNTGAAVAFVKIYNKASAPTVGTDVPILTVAVAAGGVTAIPFADNGYRLSSGLALAITNLGADTDTTVVAAAQVKVLATYL